MVVVCARPCCDIGTCGCWCFYPTCCPLTVWDRVCETCADGDTTMVYQKACSGSFTADMKILNPCCGGTINCIGVFLAVATCGGAACFAPRVQCTNGTFVCLYCNSAWVENCVCQTYTCNPSTCSAWTWADLDTVALGFATCLSCCKWCALVTQAYMAICYTSAGWAHSADGISSPTKVDGLTPVKVDGI